MIFVNGVKKIVIAGAPNSGKSQLLDAVSKEFAGEFLPMEELATKLFQQGFPIPKRNLQSWTPQWQENFQNVFFSSQHGWEQALMMEAVEKNIKAIGVDTSMLCGYSYLECSIEEYCEMFGFTLDQEFATIPGVVFLETVALNHPDLYEDITNHDTVRHEDPDRARCLHQRREEIWSLHPNCIYIPGTEEPREKLELGMEAFEQILSSI